MFSFFGAFWMGRGAVLSHFFSMIRYALFQADPHSSVHTGVLRILETEQSAMLTR